MKTRQDYPDLYSFRADNLWKELKEEDDIHPVKVISYFKPRVRGEPEISGAVYKPPQKTYDKVFDVNRAITLLTDVLFTERLSGGSKNNSKNNSPKRRQTLRKNILALKEFEVYDYIVLIDYLRQVKAEGFSKCVLTSREVAIILSRQKKTKRKT